MNDVPFTGSKGKCCPNNTYWSNTITGGTDTGNGSCEAKLNYKTGEMRNTPNCLVFQNDK